MIAGLRKNPGAILFVDEIHTVIGAGAASGGVMDASNLIKPVLANGELRCIGSTTYQEYRGIFEKDHALARRFQKIDVLEPTVEETVEILKGLQGRFEEHHGVVYKEDALKAAAELSARHIGDRHLPDKAIDVIDEAGASLRLQGPTADEAVVSVELVENIVAKMARIPPKNVSASDRDLLKNLERNLKLVIFGQDEAISNLSSAIKMARSGLRDEQKPVGAFLFTGPTGVGKTEVTRQLAMALGVELVRFDMSEYMERHTVSRLIGAPPGYVGFDQGGLLTEAITKNPHSVLLLDEIEKAHPEVFNLLLQVMDHGTLTDNNGRKADFRNVIIVLTTNAGAKEMSRASIGFTEQDHSSDGMEAIRKLFTPEFRNRLDAVVQFKSLDARTVVRVVDKLIVAATIRPWARARWPGSSRNTSSARWPRSCCSASSRRAVISGSRWRRTASPWPWRRRNRASPFPPAKNSLAYRSGPRRTRHGMPAIAVSTLSESGHPVTGPPRPGNERRVRERSR